MNLSGTVVVIQERGATGDHAVHRAVGEAFPGVTVTAMPALESDSGTAGRLIANQARRVLYVADHWGWIDAVAAWSPGAFAAGGRCTGLIADLADADAVVVVVGAWLERMQVVDLVDGWVPSGWVSRQQRAQLLADLAVLDRRGYSAWVRAAFAETLVHPRALQPVLILCFRVHESVADRDR